MTDHRDRWLPPASGRHHHPIVTFGRALLRVLAWTALVVLLVAAIVWLWQDADAVAAPASSLAADRAERAAAGPRG